MLTIQAPAKLNLTLEVLFQRPDGFHEIRSVVQTINLCDTLRFESAEDIRFRWDNPDIVPEESPAFKAAHLFRKTTGYAEGAKIEIKKRIPLLSGLGGESSGAAAVLRGLNRLWGLGLSRGELVKLAVQLGSDVAFFLYGGTALVEGRGEVVNPLPPLTHMWVVLLVPPLPRDKGKTKRLYASLKPSHYTRGQVTDGLVSLLTQGEEIEPSGLFNVFDGVAPDNFARIEEYRRQFLTAGAGSVQLAGSGPTLFTLVKDKAGAERIYRYLKQQGLECYTTDTLALLDEINRNNL